MTEALRREGAGLTCLIVRLGALGDVLRTLPAVRRVRRALPRARLFWVVDDRWSALLEAHPDLDGLLALPRAEWNAMLGEPSRWLRLVGSIRRWRDRVRAVRPDLVLDFHGNLRSGVVGRLSGAAVRLGYSGHQQKELNRLWTTHRVASGARRVSRVERNLELVRALGIEPGPLPAVELPLAAAGARPAGRLLAELGLDRRPFAVVNPGASRAQAHKKPPGGLLAAAARRLSARGVVPLVVWGPGEEQDAAAVVAAGGASEAAARLAPRTDLATLCALLARARMFVGGDSGPLHMACAAGCPVLGIYGPTDPEVNRPWGVPCRAVHPPGRRYSGIKRRDRLRNFEGLSIDVVESAVDDLLRETETRG